jgi:fructan beta-fructosidase
MFEITVDKTGEKKWVLIVSVGTGAPNGGSGTQYFVGQFNGNTFINDNSKETVYWLDYGPDDYAGVTWSNIPNGRHLFLGWMSNWNYAQKVPTQRWRSAMTVPRELSLRKTSIGYRLFSNPVKNLAALRTSTQVLKGTAKTTLKKGLYELNLVFNNELSTADDYGVSFLNDRQERINIGYNKTLNQFYIDRSNAGDNSFAATFNGKNTAPRLFSNKLVKMQLLVDHSSIELFADDGSVLMTALFFPGEILTDVQVYGQNGKAVLQPGILHELKSVW